jgi:DNA-binding response OmpR family regulator
MPRLLCVGNDPELLQTRCAVLNHAGYNTQAVVLEEAESLMRMSEFDLAVVSAWLSDEEKGRILSAAGETPILVLTGLTLAKDLLANVERMLRARQRGVKLSRDMRSAGNAKTSTIDQNI